MSQASNHNHFIPLEVDLSRKKYILKMMLWLASPLLLFFAVYRAASGEYITSATLFLMIAVLGGTWFWARRIQEKERQITYYSFALISFITLIGFLIIFMFITAGGVSRLTWSYIFVVLAFLTFNLKLAYFISAAFLCTLLILLMGFDTQPAQLSNVFLLRFVLTYSLLAIIMGLFEQNRIKSQQRLSRKHRKLAESEDQLRQTNQLLSAQIQQRQKTEAKLRETSEKLEAIIEASPLGILTVDPEGNITSWSKGAQRIYGWTSEEIMSNPGTFMSGEGKDFFKENMDRILRGESNPRFEARYQSKDGALVDIIINAAPLHGPQGEARGMVFLMEDITNLKSTEKALGVSQQLYKSLYDYTPAMLQSLDTKGRLIKVNQTWLNTLGYREDEVLGKRWFDFLSPDSRRYAQEEMFPRFLKEGHVNNISYTVIKKDGGELNVNLSGKWVKDPQSDLVHALCVLEDTTERARLEEERIEHGKMQAAIELAGAVCHELNQPLQTLSTRLELILMSLPPDHPQREDLKSLDYEVRRLVKISKRVQQITRYKTKVYVDDIKIMDLKASSN
jgi:PAS domain S-box-containing protein